jgi:hypothetical protein
LIRNDFGDRIVAVVANLRYKVWWPGWNLIVKCLRDEWEERPVALGKDVRGHWRTHQIGYRLGNTTDKLDFGIKILLVDSVIVCIIIR